MRYQRKIMAAAIVIAHSNAETGFEYVSNTNFIAKKARDTYIFRCIFLQFRSQHIPCADLRSANRVKNNIV